MTTLMVGSWISFILCFLLLPLLLAALLGALLWWLLFGRKKHAGDLTVEGEGALRAEADSLRARVRELEGNVKTRDTTITDLKGKLAAGAAGAAAATAAAAATSKKADDDDASYALEWRNRYLAARVKYLEGRLADGDKPAPKKKAAAKKKAAPKKKPAAKKAPAKKAAKPKVLYTDGPTDGAPDDLKLISGIGPKFEKDLNSKGIYYFRQIANWKKADVTMVEGVIDSIPGRIERDEWVKQAKGFAKSGGAKAAGTRKKASATKSKAAKPAAKKSAAAAKPKAKAKAKAPEKGTLDYYYADVQRYHKSADKKVVESIVKHLGVALQNRDTSLVACSDQKEVDRVVEGWCAKKLEQDAEAGKSNVASVCEEMKKDRFKQRVTFYYLCAKNARKLALLK